MERLGYKIREKELQPDGSWKKPGVPKPKSYSEIVLTGAKCVYCKSNKGLTLDHIIPKARGGSNKLDNLQPMCSFCNSRKGCLTDVEITCIFNDLKERGVYYEWEIPYKRWLDWLEYVTSERD
jgi:hypothetical protein